MKQIKSENPKYALISVSDKEGLVPLAKNLIDHGYKILATGGTYKSIKDSKLPVQEVSKHTGFPEIMEGRVKTLHPKIFGGILAIRDSKLHQKQALTYGIPYIDIVVINLYPFVETVKSGAEDHEAIEQIDIGGPSLLRAAAKNFQDVTVITDKQDYSRLVHELNTQGKTSLKFRRELAAKVFSITQAYDAAIAQYLGGNGKNGELLNLHYEKVTTLRYGENPHQKAAFFRNPENKDANVTNAKVLQGKQLSFNNIVDANAAIELVKDFNRPAAAVIKHTNPCGVAEASDITTAFELAYEADSLSAFGGVIALNKPCTTEIAKYIKNKKLFVELIIAPGFSKEAIEIFEKRPNLRVLALGELKKDRDRRDLKKVAGGILVQSADTYVVTEADLQIVSKKKPKAEEIATLLFARNVVKHVKSNAVVFAKENKKKDAIVTTGIGAGQMSRVDSVFIARHKGGNKIQGSVMASDAFFPFSDAVEEAHKAGVKAIIQPGGSIRDDEVIAKVNELKIAMVFTGIRSFKH